MNDTTDTTDRAGHRAASGTEPVNPTVVAVGALALGLVLLMVAFANLDRVPGWADDYGAILVYLAFFLYMCIAGRLTWWGIDTLRDRVRAGRGRR
ncbi:hypothetical protein [Nocardia terpenica]|uniref:Uncharacterized protein n=1 Tax=Nocardia terpenica TaxID=455432 RepID=A0A164P0F0_9NOCA|nr:hypothetical protein [Nocardia terpenica]KZM74948.1 hypothetical protein AWN90_23335 [Nocardia terpenica]NQE93390.1 hypothetical protein [Nocardia terpenica]